MIQGDYPTNGFKYLTAGRLVELLSTLPLEAKLTCSSVTRNLAIIQENEVTGQVDFIGDGEIEMFTEEPTNG